MPELLGGFSHRYTLYIFRIWLAKRRKSRGDYVGNLALSNENQGKQRGEWHKERRNIENLTFQ